MRLETPAEVRRNLREGEGSKRGGEGFRSSDESVSAEAYIREVDERGLLSPGGLSRLRTMIYAMPPGD